MSGTAEASGSSLASRMSGSALDPSSNDFTPSASNEASGTTTKTSWADDVESPAVEKNDAGSLDQAQVDGSVETEGGSGLQDGQYDVEVTLSELQGDSTSPLYSIQKFEDLGMYV